MSDKPRKVRDTNVVRFHQSGRNWLRITTVRVIVQTVVFAMFASFVLLTTFAHLDRHPGLRLWVSKVLEVDPLVALATAIATHTVYRGLLWSLVILIPTLLLGRFFCGWICPYGALHHFVGWAFGGLRGKRKIEANLYRPLFRLKYYILAAMLVAAVFGSLQVGLLDPICLLYRSFTGSVVPAVGLPLQSVLGDGGAPEGGWLRAALGAVRDLVGDVELHQGGWLIGFLLFGFVAMNLVIPRFFCRVLCPLGALLGVLSRFSWWRIERNRDRCDGCHRCPTSCEGACDPHLDLRKSECFVCFNCIEDCPCDALSFAFLPPKEHEVSGPDARRRSVLVAAAAGLLFYPFARNSGRSTRDFSSKLIRPPGSVEESEFLKRCIKCGQCIRVCPTNVLQPAWDEGGVEGLWTPVMNYRMGHCQLGCTACGHVCPTGAIQRLTVDEKLGLGAFAEKGPIRLGTAHFDVGRCLPYSKNIPCVVCEEVCPTSPKAVFTERQMFTIRDGRKMVTEASANRVSVRDWPKAAGLAVSVPVAGQGETASASAPEAGYADSLRPGAFQGDETTAYYLSVRHPDGTTESHRIAGNDGRSITVEGGFLRMPAAGTAVTIKIDYKVPKIDTRLCIGCGLCERECPVVGDRRAVYVTAEGETRSEYYGERDRNRSLRLMR